jgi:hypothetical protein
MEQDNSSRGEFNNRTIGAPKRPVSEERSGTNLGDGCCGASYRHGSIILSTESRAQWIREHTFVSRCTAETYTSAFEGGRFIRWGNVTQFPQVSSPGSSKDRWIRRA